MTRTLDAIEELGPEGIAPLLRKAGLSGAGGGGFPTYVKWRRIDDADYLLVNHQESEPNCYLDAWLGREHADRLAALFDALLETTLDAVVVGAKRSKRDRWFRPLEAATDGTVYGPDDLPLDVTAESGVVFAYTDDTYEYGMENVLLQTATGTILGKDLPIDYGWIVQNTETVHNAARAVVEGDPVTRKLVHIDGYLADGRRLPHRLFDVPVGTPASALLGAAGVDLDGLADDRVLAEGGPGWCFKVQRPPERFGVRKRTNCLLVLGEDAVDEHTFGNDRVDVLDAFEWSHGRTSADRPTTVDPDRVQVPIVTNPAYDPVAPSAPAVELGDRVSRGDRLADPVDDGFSVAHHAPFDAEVTDVTHHWVELRR